MKKLITILFFIVSVCRLAAQNNDSATINQHVIDSLKHEFKNTQNDTLRLVFANQLRYNYFFLNGNSDSALVYSKLVLQIAQN